MDEIKVRGKWIKSLNGKWINSDLIGYLRVSNSDIVAEMYGELDLLIEQYNDDKEATKQLEYLIDKLGG